MKDTRTDEELNRIIAEWRGWKWHDHPDCMAKKIGWKMPEKWLMHPDGTLGFLHDIPPYCTDLNACNEAAMKLELQEKGRYAEAVCEAVRALGTLPWVDEGSFAHVEASARQRAEALVRVIEEGKV